MRNIFTRGPIPPTVVSDSLSQHADRLGIGAHSLFLGQVRADPMGDGSVAAIEYTAYEPMALEEMEVIRKEVFQHYPLTCLHVHHSLGTVPAGSISLFVFASAPHRRAAIDACNETVEKIKARLPVWGREISDNQQSQWKENQ